MLKIVNKAYLSIDNDRSVIKTINMIYDELKDDFDLSFGNGGDQKNNIIPEKEILIVIPIKSFKFTFKDGTVES